MERRYVIQPNDHAHGWRASRLAADGLKQAVNAAKDAERIEVIIRPYEPPRTDPQRKTLWMWHGEVASALSVRCPRIWSKEDVHEVVFLEMFMPRKELVTLEGEIKSVPVRTSEKRGPDGDERPMKAIISEAMDKYLAWAYSNGIDVTVPEGGW